MLELFRNNETPVCFLPSGKLVTYGHGRIYIYKDGQVEKNYLVPISSFEKYFGKIRIFNRLFRLGIRCAIAIDENHILLSKGNCIHELDLDTGSISSGYTFEENIRPLSFCDVKDISNFKSGIYFGGYLGKVHPTFRVIDCR